MIDLDRDFFIFIISHDKIATRVGKVFRSMKGVPTSAWKRIFEWEADFVSGGKGVELFDQSCGILTGDR